MTIYILLWLASGIQFAVFNSPDSICNADDKLRGKTVILKMDIPGPSCICKSDGVNEEIDLIAKFSDTSCCLIVWDDLTIKRSKCDRYRPPGRWRIKALE